MNSLNNKKASPFLLYRREQCIWNNGITILVKILSLKNFLSRLKISIVHSSDNVYKYQLPLTNSDNNHTKKLSRQTKFFSAEYNNWILFNTLKFWHLFRLSARMSVLARVYSLYLAPLMMGYLSPMQTPRKSSRDRSTIATPPSPLDFTKVALLPAVSGSS